MNAVSFVGYVLAFLVAVIIAARWIYRNHPALRDADPTPSKRPEDAVKPPPGSPRQD